MSIKAGVGAIRVIQFVALVLLAILLIPLGAHAFELPQKMALSREEYFIVQQIYRGWAWFGIDMIAALVVNGGLAVLMYGRCPFWPALIATLAVAFSLAIFLIWTLPANQATHNWTFMPADWRRLRWQWEYSHASSAVVVFMGFCAAVSGVLFTRDAAPRVR